MQKRHNEDDDVIIIGGFEDIVYWAAVIMWITRKRLGGEVLSNGRLVGVNRLLDPLQRNEGPIGRANRINNLTVLVRRY